MFFFAISMIAMLFCEEEVLHHVQDQQSSPVYLVLFCII
jgi:hypothetical protein